MLEILGIFGGDEELRDFLGFLLRNWGIDG